ncbi:hypothetical protein SAMN04487988_10460 [Algoriphagus hitonicola]|uniref:Uncharacterized protein n=1 Tax=Algoriphagus hitonicola TaxID=435880 RepID=A0A1I2S014_9BACT|nr:hypothetical protein [Algoriphagus hitonicola]SFG46152.1 hypothetical protein SAMN04487988_10460 [Algoriphagus hitonicola]
MNWKKPIRFKISGVPWEIPLNVLLLLIFLTILLMSAGAYLGFQFGSPPNP